MKHIFKNKVYHGTYREIKGQLIIDLRDLFDYSIKEIKEEIAKIPDTYAFNIGIDTIFGTKEEILEAFLRVQRVAPIVSRGCWVTILDVQVYVPSGKHIACARDLVIKHVKDNIDEL